MPGFDPFSLGIVVGLLGLAFWVLTRLTARSIPSLRPMPPSDAATRVDETLSPHTDLVFVVLPGGRLASFNSAAREALQLAEGDTPSLERVARAIRPQDAFLSLCGAEGQSPLVVNGRAMVGTSYRLPLTPEAAVVVTLRAPESGMVPGDASPNLTSETLQTYIDLTRAMASSLDLQETLRAVLVEIRRLLPADFSEVAVWEAEMEALRPYRLSGIVPQEFRLERVDDCFAVGEGLAGQVARTMQAVVGPDPDAAEGRPSMVEVGGILARAWMSVPLIVGQEFLGTLTLASLNEGEYQKEDLDLLRLLGDQAAVAVHNALLYQMEQHRANELNGLAQLAQAFSSARDAQTLFTNLVQSIAPLVAVEILGFLLYNESQRMLEGQVPFYGLPPQFLELYKVRVDPGSPLEASLLAQDIILSENAAEDPNWERLGLERLSQGASLRETALIPLVTGGRMLGYLQASNHREGRTVFSQDEMHLLTIIANQVAPILENAGLMHLSRQRAQRAEGLRRIASLTSSAATLDEILKFSLQELAHLLHAQMGVVFLLNADRSSLLLHKDSAYGTQRRLEERSISLTADDPQFPFTVSASLHPTLLELLDIGQKPIIPFYRQFFQTLDIVSAVVVPLVVRDEGIGELWLGSTSANFFDRGDLQVVSTAAGQLAGVVEQSYLVTQTDESLRRRVEQLTALMRISRELSTSLDLEAILRLVLEEALRTAHANAGGVLLFDLERGTNADAVLYAVGEPPRADAPLVRRALASDQPVVVADWDAAELPPAREGSASALAVPLRVNQQQAGVIALFAERVGFFDPSAVEIVQSLAAQASIALSNAFQFESQLRRGELLKREVDTLNKLFQVFQALRTNGSLEENLRVIATAITETTPFEVVLISVYNAAAHALRRVSGVGFTEAAWQDLTAQQQPWEGLSVLLDPRYKIGNAYYIPSDQRPVIPEDVHVLRVTPAVGQRQKGLWNSEDFLLLPMYDNQGQPLGLISLDSPRNGLQPDQPTLQALELFALQVALTLEAHYSVEKLQSEASALEIARSRAAQAAQAARATVPMLLRRQLSQTLSIQNLERQIYQTRTGMELAVMSSRQPNAQAVLKTMAREILARFNLQTVLIAEAADGGPRLAEVIGTVPAGVNPDALFGQRNPLRQLLEDGSILLVADRSTHNTWKNAPLLNALEARSLIGLPIRVGEGRQAALLAVGTQPLPPFGPEDHQLFSQLTSQVEIALQNLQYLADTRRRVDELDRLLDFSRRLGSLDPNSILDVLAETILRVLPSANAAWVGLWDAKDQTLNVRAAHGYADSGRLKTLRFTVDAEQREDAPLPMRAFLSHQTQRAAEMRLAQDYNLGPEDLLTYRKGIGERLPLSSLVVPLLRGDQALGVLVIDNFTRSEAFSADDQVFTESLSQQAALALENARLFVSAEERAAQLMALNQVSGALASNLQSEDLITTLLGHLRKVLPFDTATLWLRTGEQLAVAAAQGFADDARQVGLSVDIQDSRLFQEMIATGQALCVPDVRLDERFPSLIEPDYLSWVGIPLIAKGQLVGAIALEKAEADYYSADQVRAATTFASQAAISLENARLFEESERRAGELDQRSRRLAMLNRFSFDLGGALDLDTVLEVTARQLQDALGAEWVSAVLLGSKGELNLSMELPGGVGALPLTLPRLPLFERLADSRGIFTCADVHAERDLQPLTASHFDPRGLKALMALPLLAGSNLYGWMWAQMQDVYRFSLPEIDLGRTITNQAALAIQNARLFAETRRLTEDLERRVEERTAEMMREHQNTQTLLSIITELSASLDLRHVLTRTLSVLNDSLGAEQSLILLTSSPTIYRAGADGISSADGVLEKELSRWVMRHRAPALVDDLPNDARWNSTGGPQAPYRSVVAVPLILGEEISGTLLMLHRQEAFFMVEQVSLVEAVARQVGVTLGNAELFNLIRDQAENMGSMLRDQQIAATRSRAILEAVADGVLVTDESGKISLFNLSAQRILGMDSAQVVGKSLDQFTGLFGKAAQSWMQTIRAWSDHPYQYQNEMFAEQIELDDGRVVAVHLAAVIYREEFLGTVSIFRDITHEVQVDRLKSEFVANVSHELRTPMTSIKGYVDIMLMGAAGAVNDKQRHFLEIVRSNTERLSVLVNDLLDISRIESGRVTLNFRAVNLREVAEDVDADIRRRSREENKAMEFVYEIPDDLPPVRGDLERVRQVLGNLVTNGYNYTPAGGLVTVQMHAVDQGVQVDVTDNGIGIAPKDQGRIFERFYRGEDQLVLATAGTGLGLSLSKTIIEMHHGRIWFSSQPGNGSTFSFILPVFTQED